MNPPDVHRNAPNRLVLQLLLCFLLTAGFTRLAAQTTSVIQGFVTDRQGLAIADSDIKLSGPMPGNEIRIVSDSTGSYRIPGLQTGTYNLRVAKPGFAAKVYDGLNVTVNRALVFDVVLDISKVQEEVTVFADPPLLEKAISSSELTILPQQIEQMPSNGRNYLDLMQLVPGVTVNRQTNAGSDAATPVLGERGGNAIFLIDGMPNQNAVDGGPGAQFDQNSILEFQVLTAGYKAEFGHGSGGVVNVVTKSGTNEWHGLVSAFHRNNAFDSSDIPGRSTPFLLRWDPSVNLGGPVIKDRVFFFGSLERIRESRELNFVFPPGVPPFLQARENAFDKHSQIFETRSFLKVDAQMGRHRITEQMSLSNGHVTNFLPLSQSTSLPSTRTNSGSRHLVLGLHDTATLGDQNNPFLMNAYVQYRGQASDQSAAQPQAGTASTLFNLFSSLNTNGLTGDLGQVKFGAGFTPLHLNQQYLSTGANLDKVVGRHDIKFGWDFQNTRAYGTESGNLSNQLFATVADFAEFGPVESGVYILTKVSGLTPEANSIRLRNNYHGLFVQDDWKVSRSLTLNLGLRWDYDSRFPNRTNFSPRLGVAWSPTSKTVLTASWGMFYDRFRLGLARDIPGFGGADLFRNQTISFPRLFYGDPTTLPQRNGLCLSQSQTDSQIQSNGTACPVAGLPLFGVDHLNSVVAPGHAPVPPNTAVNSENVQALTGLSAQQFANAASAAVGLQPGFFSWGGFGHLTTNFLVPRIFPIPITVDPGFRTPFTRSLHFGAQRELTANLVIQADYQHRGIRNMLGVRPTNLTFEARLPGRAGELQTGTGSRQILGYGPWYEGRYDGISVGIRKRMSKRFSVEAFYTWADAMDNALNSSFVSEVQAGGLGAGFLATNGPTDSFVGIPPLVKDPVSGKTNADGRFIASNGNPVPQAGKYYNGANLDYGPSDLAVNHSLLLHGMVQLPWRFEISGIFRAQSGFHYTAITRTPTDIDGGGLLKGADYVAGRNHFQAPAYANADMRFSKRFEFRERVHIQTIFEFFNLLNRPNTAAVQQLQNVSTPLGTPQQYLPGREGQLGLRIEF